jgi:hypothetical protein
MATSPMKISMLNYTTKEPNSKTSIAYAKLQSLMMTSQVPSVLRTPRPNTPLTLLTVLSKLNVSTKLMELSLSNGEL